MKMTEDKNIAAEEQEKAPESEATEEIESIKEIEEIEEIEEVEQTDKKESRADKKKVKKLEAKIAELEGELEKKAQELSEQNDKYMRMMAEYDNFRKRSAKEREGTYADAYADALASILPIIDNLERAVGVTEADGVLKGLEMTLKGADEALKKMGVEAYMLHMQCMVPCSLDMVPAGCCCCLSLESVPGRFRGIWPQWR